MKKILVSSSVAREVGSQTPANEVERDHGRVMQDLREMVFALKPSDIGLERSGLQNYVWGTLLECGIPNGCYSLVVLADGTTSLYFSTGGGVIGAGEHSAVRVAGKNFLNWANECVVAAIPASSHPLPTVGQVIFYFLSHDGVYSYAAEEIELDEQRDKLSRLFDMGQEVISHIREIKQST